MQDLTVSTNPNSSLWADAAAHLESACALLDGHQVPESSRGRQGVEHPRMGPSADAPWTVTDSRRDGVTMTGHFTEAHVGGNRAVHGGMDSAAVRLAARDGGDRSGHRPTRTPSCTRLRKITPDQPTAGGSRHDHRDRRPEGFHHGYHDGSTTARVLQRKPTA